MGAVRWSKAPENQRRVAEDFASQKFGNLSNGKRHKLLTWIIAVTIKAAAANSTLTLKAGGDDLALNSARQLANLRASFGWQKQTLTTDNSLITNR